MQEKESQNATNILGRLKLAHNIKSDIELAAFLNVARNTVSTWKSRNTVDYTLLFSKCDSVNIDWLITGEGVMLKYKASDEELKTFDSKCAENAIIQNDGINDGVNDGKRNVQKTPSFKNYKERHEQNTAPLSASAEFIEVPYADDVYAAAGGGASNADYLDLSTVIRLPAAILPRTRAQRLCINVTGESMEPTIPDGSLLVVTRVEPSEYINIRSNHVYVVTDREGSTWVKRVENNLRTDGVLTLSSDGAYKRMYQPFDVDECDIYNIWLAELCITGTMSDCAADVRRNDISIMQLDVAELRTEMATIVALVKAR